MLLDRVCSPSYNPILDFVLLLGVNAVTSTPCVVRFQLRKKWRHVVLENSRTSLPALSVSPSLFPDQVGYFDDDDGSQEQHQHRWQDHSWGEKDIVVAYMLVEAREVSMVIAVHRDREWEVWTAVDEVAVWAPPVVMTVPVDIIEVIFVMQAVEELIPLALFGL